MVAHSALGILIKRYRAASYLSQEGLADRAGVSTRAVSDLERGVHRTPHADTLDRLAGALALSADQRAVLLAVAHPQLSTAPSASAMFAMRGLSPAPSPLPRPLPLPPTPLIGRRRERERARASLRDGSTRLLTVTGPGGAGKTHLALVVAHDLAAAFPDGACYVELAPLRDAALVPAEVARALELRELPSPPLAEQLQAHLRAKRLLLVLDNFEHLPRAALFVADLVARCPHLVILVTSRAPLRLRAERTLPLAPLPLDEAVALFRERVLAVRPGGDYDEPDLAAICARLDCLPLALELAAAQVRVLSLAQLRDHLARRLPLLHAGAADLPDRQRTMDETMNWSYGLLSEEQQRCFRALGVFPDGCTLDAARAVCSATETAAPHEVILTLATLVDASLLQTETLADGTVRFRLLELVREYAVERLRAAGEEDACRRRHAAYYAGLADDALDFGPGPGAGDAGLARELPNARAALEWAEECREPELGLRLAGFARLWHLRGEMREALGWQERMLALDAALRAQGALAAPLPLRVRQLCGFARALLGAGALERAELVALEARELAQQAADEDGVANSYATLGLIAQARGDLDTAEAAFAESVAHAQPAAHGELRHRALTRLGEIARARGDLQRAGEVLNDALEAARAAGNTWESAMIITLLGHTARQRHRYAQARAHYRESLALFASFGSPTFLAWCLEGLAATLAAEERSTPAVRLCAAAAGMRARAGTPPPPPERAEIERLLDDARAALGEPVFRAEWAAAAALPSERIVAEALALAAQPSDAPHARPALPRRRALGSP